MEASPQQQLEWEARHRPRAVMAAVVASLFTIAGAIGTGILFGDAPRSGYLSSLERALEPGGLASAESLRVPFYEYYQDNGTLILLYSVMRFIGLLALGWALTYLAVATRARRPELPRFAVWVPMAGAVLAAVAALLYDIAFRTAISSFLDGARTVARADEVTENSLLIAAQLVGLPGALFLAVGFVLVSLNAMRAGLLTRFMGVLGIITGILLIFPLGSPLPIVQCFWLLAMAVLYAGRWPNGMPRAWISGKAEPWPSPAEIREARAKHIAAQRGEQRPDDPRDDEPAAVAAGSPLLSSRKRKRKRRG